MVGQDETVANATVGAATTQGAAARTRQRSTIGFPYMDLSAAIELAQSIHGNVGLGECDDHQLAAWSKQSAKSSTFRVQVYAARTFGVLEGEGSRHKLSAIGQAVVDPNRARQARANAFLAVPLFKAIYEKYKSTVLPPAGALERDIAALGVAEKQKGRARQTFERSAEQAGFFEHGKNHLVMPGLGSEPLKSKDQGDHGGGSGGSGGGGTMLTLDPLLMALLQKIPPKQDGWPGAKRVRWFRTFAMNVSQIYDDDNDPVELKIEEAAQTE